MNQARRCLFFKLLCQRQAVPYLCLHSLTLWTSLSGITRRGSFSWQKKQRDTGHFKSISDTTVPSETCSSRSALWPYTHSCFIVLWSQWQSLTSRLGHGGPWGPVSALFPLLECYLDISSTVQQAPLCYKPVHMCLNTHLGSTCR